MTDYLLTDYGKLFYSLLKKKKTKVAICKVKNYLFQDDVANEMKKPQPFDHSGEYCEMCVFFLK